MSKNHSYNTMISGYMQGANDKIDAFAPITKIMNQCFPVNWIAYPFGVGYMAGRVSLLCGVSLMPSERFDQ